MLSWTPFSPPHPTEVRGGVITFGSPRVSALVGHHYLCIPSSTAAQDVTQTLHPFLKISTPGPRLLSITMVCSTTWLGAIHVSQLSAPCPHSATWPGASISDVSLNEAESSLSSGTAPLSFLGPCCLAQSRCPAQVSGALNIKMCHPSSPHRLLLFFRSRHVASLTCSSVVAFSMWVGWERKPWTTEDPEAMRKNTCSFPTMHQCDSNLQALAHKGCPLHHSVFTNPGPKHRTQGLADF